MTNNPNNDYFNSKEFINNLTLFENAQKAGRGCILGSDELADIAEYYFEKGLYSKAREAAEYATSLYPDAAAPLLFLANFEMNMKKDAKKAKELIDRVDDRTTPEYFTTLAEYFINIDDKRSALDTLAAGKDSADTDDVSFYILDAAYLLYDYGMTREADEWKEMYADKGSAEYLKLQARSCCERGDKAKAIELLEKVIDKDPFSADNWILLSGIQLMDDRYAEAATSAEYAIAIDDKLYAAYQNQGNAYFKMCNYEKALEAYNKMEMLCDNEVTDLLKARCFFCMQKTAEAYSLLIRAKNKCTDNIPNMTDIYKDLAIICGWSPNPQEAFKYLDWLKKNDKKDAELGLIEGAVLLSMNRLEEANRVFSEGYEMAENKLEYLFQVGVSFYEHSFDTAAYLLFKEIFNKDPHRTRGLAYLAVTCNYLGHEDEFLHYLELSTKENPDEAKAVLGEFFPKGMAPYDYLEYARRNMGGNRNVK